MGEGGEKKRGKEGRWEVEGNLKENRARVVCFTFWI
jgi:hypothetical protein